MIKKSVISALLAVSAFGLTASISAYADGQSIVAAQCQGCHGVSINGIQVSGSGGKTCSQRTEALWVTAVNRMVGKGCGVASGDVNLVAAYLATVGVTTATTTTTTATTATPTTTTATTATPTTTTATTATATTTTATTATPTTTTTTTSTTMMGCNTYVNGTTQYKYMGTGSCHSFAEDLVTGLHIVRDQTYCQQHMRHENSRGNHVHTYPHPQCM